MARLLNNLGFLYSKIQRFSESEAYSLRALEIYERLSQSNPETYESYLARILNDLGVLYAKTQRFSESEAYFLRALEIIERLWQKNPKVYNSNFILTIQNLGILYRDTQCNDYMMKLKKYTSFTRMMIGFLKISLTLRKKISFLLNNLMIWKK